MTYKKIAWITDPHFDQCDINKIQQLIKEVKQKNCDSVLITGDIAEKGTTGIYLQFFQRGLKLPTWFVLGNHDWYDISRQKGTELLETYLNKDLVLLDNVPDIKINKETCIVGAENWWDAAFGDKFGFIDGLVMNDDYQKVDLIAPQSNNKSQFERVRNLSEQCSDQIIDKLKIAFKRYNKVLLAAHVPPYQQGCVVKGVPIPNNWLNHFCDKGLGDKLKKLMYELPDKKLKIYSGHTHGEIKVHLTHNIVLRVGKAKVGKPMIADIIEI